MLLAFLCFGPMVMALVSWLIGRKSKAARDNFVPAVCGLTLIGCLLLWKGDISFSIPGFCGLGLNLRCDGFRALYATIGAFMWTMTGIFSKEYFAHYHNRNRYYFFNLMTLGATLGVFLSDDLYSTFIFFEIMSLTSYTWVAHEENPAAMRAAQTYLTVAVLGGLTTLMGLFLLYKELGTLSFDGMRAAMAGRDQGGIITAASWLVVFGFAAKAGLFPLHIWLPKAHPVAPAPASALLSGILTKSGVFGLIVVCGRIMPGNEAFGNLLLVFAVITMFLGALLALFSVDLKRTLACSSMSQIGFITVGLSMMVLLGEEGSLAAYGAVLHMMNHSLIKLCLFMAAGVVYMNLHKLDLNIVRGFGRGKPVLHIAFLLGALAIGCIPPLGSGYNSKSLLHEAILEYVSLVRETGGSWQIYKAVEILFLISGGLTIAYMTKLYICLFWEKNRDEKLQAAYDAKNKSYITVRSSIALLGSAVILPFLGALPNLLMEPLAAGSMEFFGQETLHHAIEFFSGENLIGACESMAIGAAAYLLIVRPLLMKKGEYVNRWPKWLDLENSFYRPVIFGFLPDALHAVTRFIAYIPESPFVTRVAAGAVTGVTRFLAMAPESAFATKAVPGAVTAVTRGLADLPETVTTATRHTLLKKREHKSLPPVGTKLTWRMGTLLNGCARLMNKTIRRGHPITTDFRISLSEDRIRRSANTDRATGTMSYGLLLVGIGILIICIVLLVMD